MLANYSADLFGVCSALYELGGLIVMHDASGCNSTYNTHDEPRWYDIDSMVYVSGLTEYDAILGNDGRLVRDVLEAAEETRPKFIALCGGPMPFMLGTDYRAVASIIEKRCGIPSFGFDTNGMHTYVRGAQAALAAIARRFCPAETEAGRLSLAQDAAAPQADCVSSESASAQLTVNLLGVTPLDFSVVGNVPALQKVFEDAGMRVLSAWAMGTSLEEMERASSADVNIAVSSVGIPAACVLKEKYGTPYLAGVPVGEALTEEMIRSVRRLAAERGTGASSAENRTDNHAENHADGLTVSRQKNKPAPFAYGEASSSSWIIGEPVFASSLRQCLQKDFGISGVRILCPTEGSEGFLQPGDSAAEDEDEIALLLNDGSSFIIADPIYRRVLAKDTKTEFIDFPHEAYSGRMYRDRLPVFIGREILPWLGERLKR